MTTAVQPAQSLASYRTAHLQGFPSARSRVVKISDVYNWYSGGRTDPTAIRNFFYDAIKNGASGYLLKDASIDQVAQAIRVVADGQSLISPSMATKLLEEFKTISKVGVKPEVAMPKLTDRELEVLSLVARGLNNREIAKDLFISENTVKNHVRNILEKLQLHSRMEAVMYAVREKLLDIP